MQWNRVHRRKPTHIWSTKLWQRSQGYAIGKESLFYKWEIWTATWKGKNLDHYLTSYTETNLKWSKELNIRYETIKQPKNAGSKFLDIGLGDHILNWHHLDYIKLKGSAQQKKPPQAEKTNYWR